MVLAVARGTRASEVVANRVSNEVVMLASVREFFEADGEASVLVVSAEVGSAWTLRFPAYAVVNPLAREVAIPLVYPVAARDDDLRQFLNHWLDLNRRAGTIDDLYDYWILGRGAEVTEARWSIARDVLGWLD